MAFAVCITCRGVNVFHSQPGISRLIPASCCGAARDVRRWPSPSLRRAAGGVIRFNCERELNHAVQIVGYDMTGAVPYYIVRNSWGPEYGLDGYLHVAVGGDLCGG